MGGTMAHPYIIPVTGLRHRRRLRRLKRRLRGPVLALLILIGLPGVAWAAMAVFDGAAVSKLADQITRMQEQIAAVIEVRDKVQEQIDAIGKLGKVTLPSIDLDKLGATIRRDLQCLKPDFSGLMPEIKFEDINIGSICAGAAFYRDTLWVDPDEIADATTWEGEQVIIDRIAERRKRMFTDTVTKSLAHADMATDDAAQTGDAIGEMKGALNAAENSKQQQQAIGQGQVVIAETMAKQNQLLAQMLKLQAVTAVKAGVSIEDREALHEGEGGDGEEGDPRP